MQTGSGLGTRLENSRKCLISYILIPFWQAFLNYTLLAAVFGVALATRSDFLKILWQNWWKYAILGVIDVEANFLVILAYKYTNLTSVQVY